ncbi:hypothetical protein O9K51_01680 [Purpureocillium lavendulum]|uniref:Uncharacterized protein n=1 Tax=Purpureocillium lavendulum TaxID=1247861 RepID=A0AB34G5N7_9HYPO|nr:hypothetical protein O9K51_01680 [Purpureocillium lavendulum]
MAWWPRSWKTRATNIKVKYLVKAPAPEHGLPPVHTGLTPMALTGPFVIVRPGRLNPPEGGGTDVGPAKLGLAKLVPSLSEDRSLSFQHRQRLECQISRWRLGAATVAPVDAQPACDASAPRRG